MFGPSQCAEVYWRPLQRQTAQLHRWVHQRRNTERHHQEHGVCLTVWILQIYAKWLLMIFCWWILTMFNLLCLYHTCKRAAFLKSAAMLYRGVIRVTAIFLLFHECHLLPESEIAWISAHSQCELVSSLQDSNYPWKQRVSFAKDIASGMVSEMLSLLPSSGSRQCTCCNSFKTRLNIVLIILE